MSAGVVVFLVIGLPVLAALGLAAFREWLKYRSRIGIPPERYRELEKSIESLKTENERLRKRVENLETIVASIEWDCLLNLEPISPTPKLAGEEEHSPRRGRQRET